MAKKPPVTSANSRQERIKKTGKAPASTPKGRQTTAMQRPFKPGTKTSNTTTKFAGQKALPAAGQSGGSKPPKGTTTPQRGGPTRTAAQLAQERRSAAASKRAAANLGKRASNTVPKAGQGVAKAGGNFRAPGLPKGVANAVKGATKVATNVAKSGAGKAAVKTLSTLGKVGRGLGVAGAALGAIPTINSIVNPRSEGNQQLAKAMAAVNKRYSSNYGPRFKKSGTAKSFNEKAYASQQKFNVPKPKSVAKPTAPKATSASSRSSAPGRSTTSARTSSRPAAKPAAKPKASSSSMTESSLSASDIMKGYGMRVNQTFGAESSPTPKKRQSLREQTADIKKMIEESKKRQGKG